jgi:hypothetical protein
LSGHKWQILLGLAWGAAILVMAPRYIWWMTPILAGLILSAPLTMLTSRASVGRWMRRRGLLLTPEETNTPPELVALEQRLAAAEAAPVAGKKLGSAKPRLPQPIAVPAASPLAMGEVPVAVVTAGAVAGDGASSGASAHAANVASPGSGGRGGNGASPGSGTQTGAGQAGTGAAGAGTQTGVGASSGAGTNTLHSVAAVGLVDGPAASDFEDSVGDLQTNTATVEEETESNTEHDEHDAAAREALQVDDGISSRHNEDIRGILSIVNLPARMPLQMEAAVPVYLRPRDAITGLHRLLSSAWTTSA